MSEPVHDAVVRRLWAETPYLTGVVLEVEEAVAAAYHRPGQLAALVPPAGGKVYVALASYPGEHHALEFLLGPSAMGKLGLREAEVRKVSAPFGPGFPLERAEGREVLIMAVGSGIASVRPVLEHLRRHRQKYGPVVAYLGAHTLENFPYRKEYAGWVQDGIEVVQSVSRPYVQERLQAHPRPLAEAVAFICGMDEMMSQTTAALVSMGMPEASIGRNWP